MTAQSTQKSTQTPPGAIDWKHEYLNALNAYVLYLREMSYILPKMSYIVLYFEKNDTFFVIFCLFYALRPGYAIYSIVPKIVIVFSKD